MIDNFLAGYTVLAAIAFAWALYLDWRQTITIYRNPQRWRELDPVITAIARHAATPERGVTLWFAFCLVSLLTFAWWVPHPYDAVLLMLAAAVEMAFVLHNRRLGIEP